jgi:hypothetical protein
MLENVPVDLINDALASRGALQSGKVTGYTHSPVGAGQMAESRRLQLEYDGPTTGPSTLVAKVPSQDPTSRQMAAATGVYRREVLFYQQFAQQLGLSTPTAYHASVNDDASDFVLILDDLAPARAVSQIDGAEPRDIRMALAEAAALHATSWAHRDLGNDWLPGDAIWQMLASAVAPAMPTFTERFGRYLAEGDVDTLNDVAASAVAWTGLLRERQCLWHGDFRLDNLLFDAHGGKIPLSVVDWQSVMVGPALIDVAYLLGTSIETARRRADEQGLVAGYHESLTSHRNVKLTWADCWHQYRAHAVYGVILTVAVSLGVEKTERGDAMFGAMGRRCAAQVRDLDSLSALDDLL